MKRIIWMLSLAASCAFAQTQPQPLLVANQYNITSPSQVQDNRSQTARYCDYNSFEVVSSSGSYSVQMEYSDTSSSGPWTQFGGAATVTNSSMPAIGYGFGYHSWIRFNTTVGTTAVNYSCSKNYYLPSGVASPNFTGLVYATGGAFQAATVPNIFALFSGCGGTDYPGYDGNCHPGGGSGATPTALQATVSGSALTVGFTCSVLNPCNVTLPSQVVVPFTAAATATLNSGSGTAYVYVDQNGVLTVGYNGFSVTCISGCTAVSGIVTFPSEVFPIATIPATSGTWGAVTDVRSTFYAPNNTATALNIKQAPWLAHGNGTDDDTAAINAALSSGYGYVSAPCGTYKITGTVTIPAGVSFVDSGTCSTFVYTGTGTAFYSTGTVQCGMARCTTPVQGQVVTIHVTRSSLDWPSGSDTTSIGVKQVDALLNATFRVYAQNFHTGLLVTNVDTDNFGNTYEFEGVNNMIGLHINGVSGHAAADSIFNNVLVNIAGGSPTCPGGTPIPGTYYILMEGDETNVLLNKPNLENNCVQYNLYVTGDNNIIMGARLEAISVGGAYIAGSQNTIISPYTPNGEYFPYIQNAGTGNTYVGNYGFVMDTAGAGISPIFITAPALGTMFNLDVRGDLYASGTRLALTNPNFNTFVGANSGNVLGTGVYNSALGQGALGAYVSGIRSTALGAGALGQATSSANTAAGYAAGFGIVTGTQNTCVGNISCFSDTAGNDNTIVGDGGLNAATASDNNSAVGAQALIGLTTGGGNTALGLWAGRFISDGVTANKTSLNSLYLGINTQPFADGDVDENVMGFVALGHGSHTTTLGSATTTDTYVAGIWHFMKVYKASGPALPNCVAAYTDAIAAVADASNSLTYRSTYTPAANAGTTHTLVYCDGTTWTTH